MAIEIRAASLEDADTVSAVLRRSITELCVADHENDEAVLADWLADKSPEAIRENIARPDYHLEVAVDGAEVIGVCAIQSDGEIMLNYVAPSARFRGVSRAMLDHLESLGRKLGLKEVRLASTKTAHRFYLEADFVDSGPPTEIYGIS